MATMRKQIIIDNISAGFMPSALVGGAGEYLGAIGIDPDAPLTDTATDLKSSGGAAIRPVQYAQFSSTEIDAAPIAIINEPKSDITWSIQSNGKIVAYDNTLTSAGSHSIGQVSGNTARGAWYDNNFINIATATDISRVGPLNTLPYDGQTVNFTAGATLTGGTSGATAKIISDVDAGASGTLTLQQISGIFTDNEAITDSSGGAAVVNRSFASLITNNYWTSSLSKTALTDTGYPTTLFSIGYLNHYGAAHTDGASYFLDFKQGRGFIHKLQTKTTTNQGDTDDGSAYQSVGDLSLPHDYVPVVWSGYGTDIVISGTKTTSTSINQGPAILCFWNAADELFYRIVKTPYTIISVLWYENGVLYGLGGDLNGGYALFRYVGGDAIEELCPIEDGYPPLQYAKASAGSRIVWGANTTIPIVSSGLYAYGSKSNKFPKGLNHIVISGFT